MEQSFESYFINKVEKLEQENEILSAKLAEYKGETDKVSLVSVDNYYYYIDYSSYYSVEFIKSLNISTETLKQMVKADADFVEFLANKDYENSSWGKTYCYCFEKRKAKYIIKLLLNDEYEYLAIQSGTSTNFIDNEQHYFINENVARTFLNDHIRKDIEEYLQKEDKGEENES